MSAGTSKSARAPARATFSLIALLLGAGLMVVGTVLLMVSFLGPLTLDESGSTTTLGFSLVIAGGLSMVASFVAT